MDFDDIAPVLNPIRAMDLDTILRLTPARLRPAVAMAFADLDHHVWALRTGFQADTVYRWIRTRERKLPLGAALRLAQAIGCDVTVLFADYV